jgi:hypothetical protein
MANEEHPAGRGLLRSGLVVSAIRKAANRTWHVDTEMAMVCIEIQGVPCGTLACFTVGGAREFVTTLNSAFAELQRQTGRTPPTLSLQDAESTS